MPSREGSTRSGELQSESPDSSPACAAAVAWPWRPRWAAGVEAARETRTPRDQADMNAACDRVLADRTHDEDRGKVHMRILEPHAHVPYAAPCHKVSRNGAGVESSLGRTLQDA